ncbi:MAG: hypothetical protein PSN34_00055 [Urechidicola sp.]|nr:hypothetical protein [Urechidicola sp.]
MNYTKYILVSITFLLLSCEKTYDDSEVTIVKKLAYLKEDMSLITGKVKLYSNDTLMSETNYKDGLKNGYYRWWHKNGQMSFEANFKDNKVVGMGNRWYENGQVKYKGNYKDGKEHGVHTIYGKNGMTIGETTYMNGDKIESSFNLEPFDNENISSFSIEKTMKFTIENYTFSIYWDEKLSHSENIGYYGGIKSMTISKDGKTLNELYEIEDKIALGEINLMFYDYNFDGYIDFTIPLNCGKICWKEYYLFNPKSNQFEHKKEWDYLRIRQIDKINKWIKSESSGNTVTDNSKLYKVKGLELIEIEID